MSDSDSEAPEEFNAQQVHFHFLFTSSLLIYRKYTRFVIFQSQFYYFDTQAIQKDQEINTIQKQNKARYICLSI